MTFLIGLMRFDDLINFSIIHYLKLKELLEQEMEILNSKIQVSGNNVELDINDQQRIKQNIQCTVLEIANQLKLIRVSEAIDILIELIKWPNAKVSQALELTKFIWLQRELETNHLYLFLYPTEKIKKFLNHPDEWRAALSKFQDINYDIQSATDLYALGHNTACIFHCMKILEIGLSKLAEKLEISTETDVWGNIIESIEAEIRKKAATMKSGYNKSQTMQYYSEMAKEFSYFKDGWRNHVAHKRAFYDEHQAASVLEHTKDFMNRLSSLF